MNLSMTLTVEPGDADKRQSLVGLIDAALLLSSARVLAGEYEITIHRTRTTRPARPGRPLVIGAGLTRPQRRVMEYLAYMEQGAETSDDSWTRVSGRARRVVGGLSEHDPPFVEGTNDRSNRDVWRLTPAGFAAIGRTMTSLEKLRRDLAT